MFKSIEHYSGTDPDPSASIDDIRPLSRRAYTLMVRNRTSPLLQEGFLNVSGAVEMLAGLEYHRDNIVRLSAALAAGAILDEANIFHEAVAYVNRLGQFYYFAKSRLVTRAIGDGLAMIPTIKKYIIFRNKHAAHRSIDFPKAESEDTQLLQAMSLGHTWGKLMTLKPGAQELRWPRTVKAGSPEALEIHRQEWLNRYITFQMYDEENNRHLNFTIEMEHDAICDEAYNVLSAVIKWEPDHRSQ